jgi:hypothetical protein
METAKELEGLSVGSRVVVHYRHDKQLAKIERGTKTQWIIGESRYRKSNGEQIGRQGSYYRNPFIMPATRADVEYFIRRRLVARLNAVEAKDIENITTPKLEEACLMLGLLQ